MSGAVAAKWILYPLLARTYATARAAHSAIHCSYNKVIHRFVAFAASFLLPMALWALVAWDLVIAGRG